MASFDDKCPLRIEWETRGADECPRVIVNYRIESAFMTSADNFSIDVYDTDPRRLRYLATEPVKLWLYETCQLIGRVDSVQRGHNGRMVTLRGRDYVGDILECNVDPTLAFKEGMTLEKAILLATSPCGITKVVGNDSLLHRNILTGKSVKTKAAPKDFSKLVLRDANPKKGEGIYECVNKLAARHGCMVKTYDSRNTLSLRAPLYAQAASYDLVRRYDESLAQHNFIVSATSGEDYSRMPTRAMFTAKHATSGKGSDPLLVEFPASDYLNSMGASGTEVAPKCVFERILPGKPASGIGRLYRLLAFQDEDAKNQDQLGKSALRAFSERLKDTLEYSFTVKGHRHWNTGAIWSIDTLVDVKDEACDLEENLWIAKRSHYYQAGQGAFTDGTALRIGSLQL